MYARTILKWLSLAAVAIAVTLIVSTLTHHDSVRAAKAKAPSQTPGSLQAIDSGGRLAGDCPLKHTEVKAEVSGFLSRVTVTQEFENPFADKIEAVYTFPLPAGAAVDDLTMLVGDRIVKGQIMRREEAKKTYETAKSLGNIASLLNQERPNIFTQSLANIMPGQQIKVTISYVETLKYDEGSYEWSFPMVVGPRYIPGGNQPQQADGETPAESANVPDADRITPPAVPPGMRAGHDISLEITIDAGVPIDKLTSETHGIDIARADERRAIVRLQDQAAIPNKDFVMHYQVAGQQIEDAVLAHHSKQGGFFSLILQPPQRVTAQDVRPKELVFVLDTSGSMNGFPLDKAKETIQLALKNLYPYDTFNLISFAGETEVLFKEPVPATEENLKKANKFLAGRSSNGGTEMMKAIRASLEPSDSQQHVRIVCFLTDGEVGNDMEIIAEVQKHPNARVFAMGFSSAPNRFLLDKMAEYGRGEVEYVTETGDTSEVVRRFHERVRNPLLTDLSVEWNGLEVSDVYPKRIPDLFSARPVILTGRFARGGKGVIRLHGMMAGQQFVREIPVELPEAEARHDVLATLWARQRIDDLMGQDMAGLQAGKMRKEPQEEITQLGLNFKLMTQFTSFVAVDQVIFTPGGDPRRVDVPVEAPAGSAASGGISEMVTVTAAGQELVLNSSVSTTVSSRSIGDLPSQGRSFQSLALLTPGVASADQSQAAVASQNNVAVNGQRASANNFFVDGVSGNFGIAPGGQSPGASAAGSTPALTASGGANGLAPISATQEITIRTSNASAEYGRSSGAQISVVSKSGTNEFHGSLFHFLGNDAVDANDWFANSRGLQQPARRFNSFGGTLGGPFIRNRLFFFSSYEGLRLRQPMTALTDVPSLSFRRAAPASMQPFLNAFPTPNGVERPNGFAEFASSFANPARHDIASFGIDAMLSPKLSLTGHYNFADSVAAERGQGGFSLNTTNKIRSRAQMLTWSLNYIMSPTVVTEVHANYSRFTVHGAQLLDDFGGSILPTGAAASFFSPANGSFSFDLNGRGAALQSGSDLANTQRQFNVLGSTSIVSGNHSLKFGADYRRLSPTLGLRASAAGVLFDGVTQAITGIAGRLSTFARPGSERPIFQNLSLYAQDEWKRTSRLTLNYGVRWELNPAPTNGNGQTLPAVTQVGDLSQFALAPRGTPLWRTTYGNFAPRAGFAYQLSNINDREMVLRGGVGVFYGTGHDQVGNVFADSFPFLAGASAFNTPFPGVMPAISLGTPVTVPFSAFDPALKLPYTLQWNISLERALGRSQTISASYVGSAGRRLLGTQTLFAPSPDFAFVRLTTNSARSDYNALQLQFNRRLVKGLSAIAAYTWSSSLDNFSEDSAAGSLIRSVNAASDRGPSDFDARHVFAGSVSYQLPTLLNSKFGKALQRNWIVDAIFNARSARPVNVVYGFPTSYGLAYLRPDLTSGVPLYLFDSAMAGGRRINPAAFLVPASGTQGTLGRNSLRGFPLYQFDLALHRRFRITERFRLELQAEAFNLFNHPNFSDPLGSDTSLGSIFGPAGALNPNLTFGQSASLNGRSVLGGTAGAFGSLYSPGGPRAFRFSAKLHF